MCLIRVIFKCVKSDPALRYFSLHSVIAPAFQPIRCRSKTNRDLFTLLSRALGSLLVFILNLVGSLLYFNFVAIDFFDFVGFGFRHSKSAPRPRELRVNALDLKSKGLSWNLGARLPGLCFACVIYLEDRDVGSF